MICAGLPVVQYIDLNIHIIADRLVVSLSSYVLNALSIHIGNTVHLCAVIHLCSCSPSPL